MFFPRFHSPHRTAPYHRYASRWLDIRENVLQLCVILGEGACYYGKLWIAVCPLEAFRVYIIFGFEVLYLAGIEDVGHLEIFQMFLNQICFKVLQYLVSRVVAIFFTQVTA